MWGTEINKTGTYIVSTTRYTWYATIFYYDYKYGSVLCHNYTGELYQYFIRSSQWSRYRILPKDTVACTGADGSGNETTGFRMNLDTVNKVLTFFDYNGTPLGWLSFNY